MNFGLRAIRKERDSLSGGTGAPEAAAAMWRSGVGARRRPIRVLSRTSILQRLSEGQRNARQRRGQDSHSSGE